ncbi:MAG TPA: carbohydrate binding domain-containing protein [Chitinispirillaceae bacterium]|nr:carbohydrate binding domain-containing protein [Chitinispirillaceae bacterium]
MKRLFLLGLCFSFVSISAQVNQLPNGDFEQRTLGWFGWGGAASDTAHAGKNGIQVKNGFAKWSGAHQILPLPDSIEMVELSGWIKTINVTGGKEAWEKARIALDFVDDQEKLVGNYVDAAGQVDGTTDWTLFRKKYSVHKGAKNVKVIVALGNCTGEAYFDDLQCFFYSASQVKAMTPAPDSSGNLLTDAGFEHDGFGWNIFGASVSAPARSGKYAVLVKNTSPAWNGAEQVVVMPEGASKVVAGGWIKTVDVKKGKEDWETARISIEFADRQGALVGGYPPVTGSVVGTQDWKNYSMEYNVPLGTQSIKVQAALGNALGTAYFDNISLFIYDKNNKLLQKGVLAGPMDDGEWYPLEQNNTASGGHYVDWSSLLDAPAGKHGFLTVKNGRFFFKDGTPAKFWGTNLVEKDCFASNAEIDSLTSRLAKMGCNLLRLHHMDAPWAEKNIFGKSKSTRSLSATSLKQLDYLTSQCKKKGIYLFLDLLVHREFTPEDSVAEKPKELGAKQVGMYSRRLIELQKEYATQLLNHVNEYTKVAYKDEPAIIGSEIINESTIFTHFSDNYITGAYKNELESLWKKSSYKDKTLAYFLPDWQAERTMLKSTGPGDISQSLTFLSSLECAYYKEMEKHLRSIGVKYPLAGSNMPLPLLGSLKNNSIMDFTINNDYWDHPQVWKIGNNWERILYSPFHNGSQLKSPARNTLFAKSYYKLDQKPFIITEWNHCYPNEQMIEAVPLVAAYSALQGWDGVLQFDFNLQSVGKDRIRNYTLSVAPEHVALWVMGAPLFLRSDVKPAPGIVVETITDSMALTLPNYSYFLENHAYLPYVTRVAKTFSGKTAGKPEQYKKYVDEANGIMKSETGELTLDSKKGIQTINTSQVQGVSGFIGNEQISLPAFSCKVSNTSASVYAVAKSKEPLEKSSSFYLVVAGPVKMTDQKYNPSRSALEEPGKMPVLAQVIKGTISFANASLPKATVTPLAVSGIKGTPIALKKDSSGKFVFNTDVGRTLVYEVNFSK